MARLSSSWPILITAIVVANIWQYCPATAAEAPPKASLFNIEIGRPLNLPRCPGGEINPLLVHKICKAQPIKTESGDTLWAVVFPFFHAPPMVSDQMLLVNTMGNNVEKVSFATDGVSVQDKVYSQLVEKFGPPTESRKDVAQNAFGAVFKILRARWDFEGFTVSFDGSDGKINSGDVAMKSEKFTAAERASQARRRVTEPKM